MKIAQRVREIMQEKGMSQADLCRASGLRSSEVSEILNKRRRIGSKTLERLAAGLGVSPAELVAEPEGELKVGQLLEREIGEAAMWELLEWVRKIKKPSG